MMIVCFKGFPMIREKWMLLLTMRDRPAPNISSQFRMSLAMLSLYMDVHIPASSRSLATAYMRATI
jgi:hypothetical protein